MCIRKASLHGYNISTKIRGRSTEHKNAIQLWLLALTRWLITLTDFKTKHSPQAILRKNRIYRLCELFKITNSVSVKYTFLHIYLQITVSLLLNGYGSCNHATLHFILFKWQALKDSDRINPTVHCLPYWHLGCANFVRSRQRWKLVEFRYYILSAWQRI